MAPRGFEHISPLQYKAMQGIVQLYIHIQNPVVCPPNAYTHHGFIWAKNLGGGGERGRKSWSNNSETSCVC